MGRNGVNGGTCASGFGVCCICNVLVNMHKEFHNRIIYTVNRGCGATTSENCTFFEVSLNNVRPGQCSLQVCPCNSNICQIRLDFNTFVIAGPSTSTTEVVRLLNGAAARYGLKF